MKKARQISDISSLAEEILGDIFSRLPVKTLLRLKVVCTRWCTLISTPWFISAQLNRFSSDPENHYILFQNLSRNGLIRIRNPGCLIKLNEPCMSKYTVVGSFNGLVCLTTNCFRKLICLWNPSINQFKILPMHNLNLKRKHKCNVRVGFGYEQNSDDYKVMRILNYEIGGPATIVEVYSTKLECWRDVKTNHCLNMTSGSCDVIVEGFTYWLIRNLNGVPRKPVLASFDLKRERFSLIPVPEVVTSQHFRAMNYHGSLALLAHSSHNEFKGSLDVWMIVGGSSGEEVWQKKFTFGMDFEFSRHWGLTSGDIVVKNAPNMPFLFNLRTKQLRIIGTRSIHSVFYYTESLVSVKGFKPVTNQSKEKRKASCL
ncbi:F-box protein At3g07870-like [Solanum dulcamara]|uniref:F-box protein At3g07870-like n=1 Tax=Solanum dulcamara TaxID=45834 RepID=UPI002484E033|nr:F-box protein At3g07870-like [Solanum dulcamara]